MSDDLDFNIKMGSDNDRTRLSSNAQSSSSGYKMSSSSSKSGYQAPTSQNDPESSHNNIEENLSLFDIRKAGHPVASLFTFLFKVLGMMSYLFMTAITSDTTLIFIVVILTAAADFWTVKNITGRLLVGLRWWSEIQPDGTEKWHFESHDQQVKLHPIDRRVFWWSQTVACIFWAVIVLLKILGLSLYWGTCSGICLTLSVVNYWGYYKCSKDHQKKLNNLFRTTALSGLRRGLGFGF